MDIPDEVMNKAYEKVNSYTKQQRFPRDSWFSLSKDFDLNLWTGADHIYADVYPVVDGKTQTKDDPVQLLKREVSMRVFRILDE